MHQHLRAQKNQAIIQHRLPLSAEQRLMVLQKLQGQLDLSLLFETFLNAIRKHIDVERLVWEHEDISHIMKQNAQGHYRQTFTIKFAQASLGVLQYYTPYALDKEEINVLHNFHRLLAGPLNNAVEYQKVKRLAMTDSLTGLKNRNRFEQDLAHAIAVSEREEQPFILMVFDLNKFKPINDQYGHLEGDRVLRQFSHALQYAIRASDRSYRLGGDEFTVLITTGDPSSVKAIQHRLHDEITQNETLQKHGIQVSSGCAVYRRGDNQTTLFDRADRHMYLNKSSHRKSTVHIKSKSHLSVNPKRTHHEKLAQDKDFSGIVWENPKEQNTMKIYDCCDLIRQRYAEIGSGDQGYIPQAIGCVIRTLNDIANDPEIASEKREQAAFAAANLLISDHKDEA